MTTAALTRPSLATPADDERVTFGRAVRSEAIKFSTLRSTWWSIGLTALVTIGVGALIARSMNVPGFTGIHTVVSPVQFTMLLAGILGAITVTGEYGTGMIRSTLTAVPVRGAVLLAKAIVVASAMFLASLAIFVAAAVAVTPLLSDDTAIDWASFGDTWMPLIAASLSMSVFALIGLSFGFLLRSGAGAIAATVGVLFVLPIVVSLFATPDPDWAWVAEVAHYLPTYASNTVIFATITVSSDPAPAAPAAAALAAWAAGGLLLAWGVFRSRDA